jgi:transposase
LDQKIRDVCTVYRQAPARAQQGERTISTDELTGLQALERTYANLPLAPDKVECREYEYIRRIVFHSTPKHSSWLNQIEIWLSILVRKLIKRGSFTSVADLQAKVLAFIDYYNRTMAKPFKWTYQGKPLTA